MEFKSLAWVCSLDSAPLATFVLQQSHVQSHILLAPTLIPNRGFLGESNSSSGFRMCGRESASFLQPSSHPEQQHPPKFIQLHGLQPRKRKTLPLQPSLGARHLPHRCLDSPRGLCWLRAQELQGLSGFQEFREPGFLFLSCGPCNPRVVHGFVSPKHIQEKHVDSHHVASLRSMSRMQRRAKRANASKHRGCYKHGQQQEVVR